MRKLAGFGVVIHDMVSRAVLADVLLVDGRGRLYGDVV